MCSRRLCAIARKEFFHILRDIRSLIAAIGIPVIMMLLYCYSLSLDVKDIPTAVLDFNRSYLSRDFIERFKGSGYFKITDYVASYGELQAKLDSSACVMGLVIPYDFSTKLKDAYAEVPAQILLDGTDPQRASTSLGYTMLIGQKFSQEWLARRMAALKVSATAIPVEARVRIWYNPSLLSKNAIIPSLIALIMAILAAFLTSLTVSREWENGTMELLITTPVKPLEVVFGKLIPYFCLGIFDTVIIVLAGWYLFDVPVKGSLVLLAVVILIFLVGVLALGLFISVSTRAQLLSSQVALMITWLPTILLSGFVFFLPAMPTFLQLISYVVPARYFISSLKGLYLKQSGLGVLWPELLFLLIFDLIVILAASKRFVKKLDS